MILTFYFANIMLGLFFFSISSILQSPHRRFFAFKNGIIEAMNALFFLFSPKNNNNNIIPVSEPPLASEISGLEAPEMNTVGTVLYAPLSVTSLTNLKPPGRRV